MTHKTTYNNLSLFTQTNGQQVALIVNTDTSSQNVNIRIASGICEVEVNLPMSEVDKLILNLVRAKATIINGVGHK